MPELPVHGLLVDGDRHAGGCRANPTVLRAAVARDSRDEGLLSSRSAATLQRGMAGGRKVVGTSAKLGEVERLGPSRLRAAQISSMASRESLSIRVMRNATRTITTAEN